MAFDLIIGGILVALGALLIFIGRPNKAGEPPRFLRFDASLVIYPPIVEAVLALGVAELIYGYLAIR
jgi:hypothetical protein